MKASNQQRGFTLVELSIVLVIVGLVVGGILIGKTLIRQAEIRAVLSDIDQYMMATRLFKEKFRALPGDLNNAYDYWGASCNTNPNNCNGNGDGLLTTTAERLGYFQQLSLAGFLGGGYSGTTVTTNLVFDENIPDSESGGGYWARDCPAPDTGDNCIVMGTHNLATELMGAALMPRNASAIDQKMDDGDSRSGKVITQRGSGLANPQCVEGGSLTYNLDEEDVTCRLHFRF